MKTPEELLLLDLIIERDAYAREHGCSADVALSEITRRCPHYLALNGLLATGSERSRDSSSSELVAEMHRYAEANHCSLAVALSEVSKRNPQLWEKHSENVMREAPGETLVVPLR